MLDKLIIFTYFAISLAFFDLEELKSFNYGIDISKEPVVMKTEAVDPDSNSVHLTSKYGQPYQCFFPNAVEQEKEKEEAEKVAMETGIPDLLKPMETAPCLKKTKDWWSYEFCYGKYIRQYHIGEDGQIQGEIILMGNYESEFDWADSNDQTEKEKHETRLRRYHTQQYVNGSACDLNGKLRKTEVRFQCEDNSADFILRLDEPATCSYIMTIHTMKICHHPFLKPPTPTKTVEITCHPALTIVQYQQYLDQIEALEEKKKLEEEREEAEEAEQNRLAEEKAKYLEESQSKHDDEADGAVETENEEGDITVSDTVTDKAIFGDESWSNIMKAAKAADNLPEMKTVFKVINNPEDLKNVINDAMEEMKNIKVSEKLGAKKASDEQEEEGGVNDGLREPTIPVTEEPTFDPVVAKDEDLEDNPDMDKLSHEIKTIKERYKDRKDKLSEIKRKMKAAMEDQYQAIIKEAEEEVGVDGGSGNMENSEAIQQLSKTLDSLLSKIDQTEKEIEDVDKELEQFAEYDTEDKYKTMPPVKQDVAEGPKKTGVGASNDLVKVRVSRMKTSSTKVPSGMQKFGDDDIRTKQTEELERSVQKELEKAGLGDGDKIQVKIITTGYYDGDDDSLHVLSEAESETFRNMIVNIIGGASEADKETQQHTQMEENYGYVWGQEGTAGDTDTQTGTTTDTQTGTSQHTADQAHTQDTITVTEDEGS